MAIGLEVLSAKGPVKRKTAANTDRGKQSSEVTACSSRAGRLGSGGVTSRYM